MVSALPLGGDEVGNQQPVPLVASDHWHAARRRTHPSGKRRSIHALVAPKLVDARTTNESDVGNRVVGKPRCEHVPHDVKSQWTIHDVDLVNTASEVPL